MWPANVANAVPSASSRIILGLVGYFLGARRPAAAAVVLSAVALVLAVAVGQGLLPWTGPTGQITSQREPCQDADRRGLLHRSGLMSSRRIEDRRRREGGPGAGRSGERRGVAPGP